MKVDSIKSNLKQIELLAKEYKENIPEHIENEVQQLKSIIRSGYKINSYDKQFLIAMREVKRNIFIQVLIWSIKILNEIDDSVGVSNIEYVDESKCDILLKELAPKERDLLGLIWELLFKIEEPREPFKEIISYVNNSTPT